MKPITDYIDYRKFMLDFYEDKKAHSVFSWREFSNLAGFSSCSYMKVVCDGKSNLSKVGVERVAQVMGLAGFEVDYFRAMVAFDQSKSDEKKNAAFEQMRSIAQRHKVRILEEKFFDYYESWRNPTLRELAPLMPGATPGELAKKCYPQISAVEVQESLKFLTDAGLLLKLKDGTYAQAETSIAGSSEATRLAIRSAHREMSKLAADSLELPVDERNITGVTMGISDETYGKIVRELDEFRHKIIALAAPDGGINQVYRLNLQFFPLTRKVKEVSHENA